ncbi:hypothetical protein PGSY75_0525700 [Plasmodium gaboni]|uniref:Uncharacterized protein n=1 Tax=Plasmodium gaboni TaxID=647221 RepID=A0A151LTE0_9APIC|nr:hypothetical protein PGSY75_0525700 [Plasmodium gaboni]KYO02453.1 hypothetical protein PGSY75_0525700 [Plasmodium gaboni]SOV12083.1 conserved Plasmodium protein, unknown function [Plasmodium gaboni]SOV21461.1 conserved Plasmodium protein, unknown function [Plasmodium sp. DRC-Itaito]
MLYVKVILIILVILRGTLSFKVDTPILQNVFLNTSAALQNNGTSFYKSNRTFTLYGVPKKKSSHRRTRRRKVAWMKKNPAKLFRTSSYDLDEIMRYTDRKLTSHYTTRDSWLNLPSTTLVNDFFLFREIRN